MSDVQHLNECTFKGGILLKKLKLHRNVSTKFELACA